MHQVDQKQQHKPAEFGQDIPCISMEFMEGFHDHRNCNRHMHINVATVFFANKEGAPSPNLFFVYHHGAECHAMPSLSPVFEQITFPLLFPQGEMGDKLASCNLMVDIESP